jgi:hypothetical protein
MNQAPSTQGVSARGWLNFNDIRAKFSENLRCEGASDELPEFNDPQAGKRE